MGTSEPVAISVAWRGPSASARRNRRGRSSSPPHAAQQRQRLAGQHQQAGTVGAADRQLPALRRLHRVGGAIHVQVRHRPQAGEMLDRLVRRAILAQADRIVRQHVDHPLAHDGAHADRRTHIVGEHKERAGVRDQPAMQRHAVRGGAHAMLAHAEMDVAPAIAAGGHGAHRPSRRSGWTRSGRPSRRPGRASPAPAPPARAGWPPRGDVRLAVGDPLLQRRHRLVPILRQLAGDRRVRTRRAWSCAPAASARPGAPRRRAHRPRASAPAGPPAR